MGNVFILIDELADKIYKYLPTHAKTQNTFWLPYMPSSTNTVVYFVWKTAIYAAKFEQTIIRQHVHLRRKVSRIEGASITIGCVCMF